MNRFLLLLLVAASCLGGELRDGLWWQALSHAQKESWVIGWMDGAAAGERIVGGIAGNADYRAAVLKFAGVESEQIVQGLDQFYVADFRNLAVGAQDAALLVAMYARGLDTAEAAALAAMLREKYKTATIAH